MSVSDRSLETGDPDVTNNLNGDHSKQSSSDDVQMDSVTKSLGEMDINLLSVDAVNSSFKAMSIDQETASLKDRNEATDHKTEEEKVVIEVKGQDDRILDAGNGGHEAVNAEKEDDCIEQEAAEEGEKTEESCRGRGPGFGGNAVASFPGPVNWPIDDLNSDGREPLPSSKYMRRVPEENDERTTNPCQYVQGVYQTDIISTQGFQFNPSGGINTQFGETPERFDSDEVKDLLNEIQNNLPDDQCMSGLSDIVAELDQTTQNATNMGNTPQHTASSPGHSANAFMAQSPNCVVQSSHSMVQSPNYVAQSPNYVAQSPHSFVQSPNYVAPSPYYIPQSPASSMLSPQSVRSPPSNGVASPGNHSQSAGYGSSVTSPGMGSEQHSPTDRMNYHVGSELSPMFSALDESSTDTMNQALSPDSGIPSPYHDEQALGVDEILKNLKKSAKPFELQQLEDVQQVIDQEFPMKNQPKLNQPEIMTCAPLPDASVLPPDQTSVKGEKGKAGEDKKRRRGRPPGSKNKPKADKQKNTPARQAVTATPTTYIIVPPSGSNLQPTTLVIPSTQPSVKQPFILPKVTSANGQLILPKPNIQPGVISSMPVSTFPERSERIKITEKEMVHCEKEKKNMTKASRLVADITLEKLKFEDNDGDTLLTIGVVKDRYMFRALVERMEREGILPDMINKANKLNQTPLYLAVVTNKPELLSLLIEKNADPNTWTYGGRNSGFKRALHVAAEKGRDFHPILKLLLKAQNIHVDSKNSEQKTPLHCAVDQHGRTHDGKEIDNKETVHILLQHKARILSGPNERTPLHTLAERLDLDFLKHMVENIQESERLNALNMRDSNGNTCLHIVASIAGKKDLPEAQRQKARDILNYLLNTVHVDFSIQNHKSETAKTLCKESDEKCKEIFHTALKRRRNDRGKASQQQNSILLNALAQPHSQPIDAVSSAAMPTMGTNHPLFNNADTPGRHTNRIPATVCNNGVSGGTITQVNNLVTAGNVHTNTFSGGVSQTSVSGMTFLSPVGGRDIVSVGDIHALNQPMYNIPPTGIQQQGNVQPQLQTSATTSGSSYLTYNQQQQQQQLPPGPQHQQQQLNMSAQHANTAFNPQRAPNMSQNTLSHNRDLFQGSFLPPHQPLAQT